MENIAYNSPSILVYCSKDIQNKDEINEILWGIEEEGIPYIIENVEDDQYKNLAHLASLVSKLGVGVGIDKDKNIALTFNKLSTEKYLFCAKLEDSKDKLRKLGANSARLVKNMPFK